MRRRGFTLVELSIVLVILGLLVGGVLAGQSLIKAAELRAVTTEFTNYKTAMNAFKEKYFALPGDMRNAVRFWGSAGGGTADGWNVTCYGLSTYSTGTETCNGNGDGIIFNEYFGPATGDLQEGYRAWQQMANAGLIEGTFGGTTSNTTLGGLDPGGNVPKSKFNGGAWQFQGMCTVSSAMSPIYNMYADSYGTVLLFGVGGLTQDITDTPRMNGQDLYNIDMKMDDGKPGTGMVMSWTLDDNTVNGVLWPCAAGSATSYVLNDTSLGCAAIFKTGY